MLQTLEKSGESPNAIERELLKSYILDLYETAFPSSVDPSASYSKLTAKADHEVSMDSLFVSPTVEEDKVKFTAKQTYARRTVKEEGKVVETTIPETEEIESIHFAPSERKASTQEAKGEAKTQALEPEVIVLEENKIKSNLPKEIIEELFHFEMGIEVSDKLANLPLKSLKGAVGINDKLMIVNTLFQGDMAKYNDLIDRVEKMGDFSQVRQYLQEEIIPKFLWAEEERVVRAREFIKLINRRFLN